MTKILFIHNTAMWYRIPFFKKINDNYELKLLFSHMNVIEDIYDNATSNNIKGLENVDYAIMKNTYGFARGLINKLLSDYDVAIGCSWDTAEELIESLLILLITKLRRKKLIIWREDWNWKKDNSLKQKILNRFIKLLSRNADAILVPGSLHKEYFESLNVSSKKIYIMPNVSNMSDNIEKIDKKDNKQILYVGRLIKRKGVIYLIKSFELLLKNSPQAKLIIIGNGEEESYLKEYVKDNQIPNITFTGKVDNKLLKTYYKSSNLVVVPSINYEMADPWVFVLNEAMYYNNPMVVTDAVGASKDMIKDNGFIVKEKSVNQLYEAMNKIINDYDLQLKMGEESKRIIESSYQYSNMLSSFIDCVDFVLNND